MIGYTMLGTNDLTRAKAFYDAVLAPLKASVLDAFTSEKHIFYAAGAGQPMLSLTKPNDGGAATAGNGTMVALSAPTRALVDEVHKAALAHGAKDEGAPGVRGPNPDGFYGAYFRDPDGNKICAFRFGPG